MFTRYKMIKLSLILLVFCLSLSCFALQAQTKSDDRVLWIDDLDISKMQQEFGKPTARMTMDKSPIMLDGKTFAHGVATHAYSEFRINLRGSAKRFEAVVGLDDEVKTEGSVSFELWVDNGLAFNSGIIRAKDKPKAVSLDISGARELVLIVDDGKDGIDSDHADWADAKLILKPDVKVLPESVDIPVPDSPKIASGNSPLPAIHGPKIVGTTPGNPFLFLIPATGDTPLEYSAKDLPDGLKLDKSTGIISGLLKKEGTYNVQLQVDNKRGRTTSRLKIVGGKHKLALTPPMGWNSWNVWGTSVDAEKVKQAADWMVKSGLAAHGYQYINIDDSWEAGRNAKGEIQSNEKFSDMKALAEYVHSKGLKLGIYSSPGPETCAGYTGSYQFEEQDAMTYAKWGIDYIKYDWCTYGKQANENNLTDLKRPYILMRDALDKCNRDIVYSLCQYGMGNVWEWGEEIGANCWRTGGDIFDTWSSLSKNGFSQSELAKYAGPGHWNDTDMLTIGKLGWGSNTRDTHLTPNQQLTHITLWSLLGTPLLLGCDLSKMDQFTIDLLTNDEVIDINQDSLGQVASRKARDGDMEVWSRPLSDGTIAVGLFNRGGRASTVVAKWSDLGIKGAQPVRNLWQKKDLGVFTDLFVATVPGRGAMLIKIGSVDTAK